MAGALPVVCIFGVQNTELKSAIDGQIPHFETNRLDCRCYLTDDKLNSILAKDRPGAVISFGKQEDFPNLLASPFEVRRIWINFEDTEKLHEKGVAAFMCFITNALKKRNDFLGELFSLFH